LKSFFTIIKIKMKFSTSAVVAATILAVTASPIPEPAKVTQTVQVTQNVYENFHVYVDQNGNPISTSVELVSSGAVAAPTTATLSVASTSTHSTSVETSSSSSSSSTTSVETSSDPTTSAAASTGSGSSDFSGDATFYSPGMGSCGIESSDSDFIAALNAPQFGSYPNPNQNPNCGKKATVQRNGKSVTVTIVDKCPACKEGDLDLSPAAFDAIADESEGRVPITWSWN
jgi:hypothetical protein